MTQKQHTEKKFHETNSCCSSEKSSNTAAQSNTKQYLKAALPVVISLFILAAGLYLEQISHPNWFVGNLRFIWYLAAYLPVGLPVLFDAYKSFRNGDFFSEFFLMALATLGAFAIKEYPEGVAVMLFYAIGEAFQDMAVNRAKSSIKSLLDQRPEQVTVLRNGIAQIVQAKNVVIGEIIELKPGEKLGLDGILISEKGSFNTAALTGESKPETKQKNETVLAGMINNNAVTLVQVTTRYEDSKLSRILDLVQNATQQKAPTELFIRKFAKIYTPIVVVLAVLICLVPYFTVSNYVFTDWLYRALVFLVISCPCALVISIPLGYFGGIGAASKHGILFKGSNFLDALAKIEQVVMDKTGTLTEGVFKVQEIIFIDKHNQTELLHWVNKLESYSTHPVATAIHEYVGSLKNDIEIKNVQEIPGLGLSANVYGKNLLVGNFKLLDQFSIPYAININKIGSTVIAIAYNQEFVGYITIADQIKKDAAQTIQNLNTLGVKTTMLSGDKTTVVQQVAKQLQIKNAFGDLLPEDKVNFVKALKTQNQTVAFVGDGVNDAPVVALSDVGIAMGGLGSDATIETADVVIQDDKPSKIPIAIRIGKQTKKIVWQNITLAFVVKGLVLILGAGGLATMWEAVFADVGVALLAILNAVRIQKMQF
ncbi:cadmium-translocating P-type ATPase [Flavobacterium agricola]|uniref:P-type Zn(2+) transporter n=1 Tax=Flavobacterium agricola TaxID=2870839 RepID=A0ABY6LZH2_9FLAO|nr:heavy metal translocating P-type ATPase [Flavobacterium agricola]UYW01715.1 cadmium-translocating P-type ATPase [Flavobacterium agricola]